MRFKNFTCDKTKITITIFENGNIFKDKVLMNKNTGKDGYHYITLRKNNIRINYRVCRLVCSLKPNPNNKPCVNHINGIKTDDYYDNLEWVTYSENMEHAVKTGLLKVGKGDYHSTMKHTFNDVQSIRNDYSSGLYSMRKLAEKYFCSSGYISDVVNNKIRINC